MLANEVERTEKKCNSQLYVEWLLALPKEENVSLESLLSETGKQFKTMRKGFEEKYTEHAKAFTEEMDPELRYLAVGLVKIIVNTIFQKSMDKWRDLKPHNTIEKAITTMLVRL